MKFTGITYSIEHGNRYYNVQFDPSTKEWTVRQYIERVNQYQRICKPIRFNGRASATKAQAQRVLLMGIHAANIRELISPQTTERKPSDLMKKVMKRTGLKR